MYRLLYQRSNDVNPSWIDSANLKELQATRLELMAETEVFVVEPFIIYIGMDGWIRKRDGTYHHLAVK